MRNLTQGRRIGRRIDTKLIMKNTRDIMAGQMQCGRSDMRGALTSELHNVFAEVSFRCLQTRLLERVRQIDFLAHHALDFDDALGGVFSRNFQNDAPSILRIIRPMNDAACLGHIRFEHRQVFIEMRDAMQAPCAVGKVRRSRRSCRKEEGPVIDRPFATCGGRRSRQRRPAM